jgi:predicted DNA-binding transcriptional regulator AlpA
MVQNPIRALPPGIPDDAVLISAKHFATMLSVSVKTLRRLLARGRLPRPVRSGRLLKWRKADAIAYVRSL